MADAGELVVAVRLLGRIQVVRDGVVLDLGASGPRSLFAVLAMRAGTAVTMSDLVDALWGESAPKSAEGTVYTYVSTLRKVLEPGRTRKDEPRVLVRTGTGYTLRIPENSVDALRFEEAAAEARRCWSMDDVSGTVEHCVLALSQWHGPPMGGTGGPFAEHERGRLELLRVDVRELRCAALVASGSVGEAAAELTQLVAENPLRERLYELLLLALARTGRQAEALSLYEQARQRLADQLGIDPGPALRQAYQSVRAGEVPSVPLRRREKVGPRLTPAQLPRGVPDFTGREAELRQVEQLCAASSGVDTVAISAIDGTAGVGKTAFTIHLAYRLAPQFPDGQLFLDLRGFDPRFAPITSEEALGHLLRGLGVDNDPTQTDLTEPAALYRSMLADQRVLIVLDNAVSADQVRPLLPGSKTCLVLVNSRNRLAGLVARDGAAQISLDVLRPEESLELLRRVLGAERIDADLTMARELAVQCAHLPLALRIAAERIVGGSYYGLADIVDELRVERDRLDTLSFLDDEASVVRAVFSWSYQALKPEDARAFRLLSLHPGVEFSGRDAAALLGAGVVPAKRLLDSLVSWHLIEEVGRDRYRFHDLLRIYAAECATNDESEASISAANERLLDWYVASTIVARTVLAPGFGEMDVLVKDPKCPPIEVHTYDEAIAWVRRELPTLIEVLRLAAERGFDATAATLATALGVLCHGTSRWTEWLRVSEIGLAAALRTGDRISQGRLHNDSGVAHHYLGRFEEALVRHHRAIEILTEVGDPDDPVITANLAVAYSLIGQHSTELEPLERALEFARAHEGTHFIESSVEGTIGVVLSGMGRHDEAIAHGTRSLELVRIAGSQHMLAHGLANVGESCLRAGRAELAITYFTDALRLWRTLGNRWGEGHALHALARARLQAHQPAGVRELLTQALAAMRESGHLPEAADVESLLATLP